MLTLHDEIALHVAELEAQEPFDEARIAKIKSGSYRSYDGSQWEADYDEERWEL